MDTQEIVHFKVDFEGMTKHIRGLWAEGSFWKCVDTIDAIGVPREYWSDVIEGRAKLIQDPDGRDGVDGMLAEDNWQPDPIMCHNQRYPKYDDLHKIFTQQRQWAQKYLDQAYFEVCALWREYRYTRYNGERLDEIIKQLQTYPLEVLELAGVDMPRFIREVQYNPINDKLEIDVDAYVKRQLELDKMPTPKPDTEFSRPCGYITPTGKFYSCEWMEHDWLVSKIGNSSNFSKDTAEKMGWIAITHPLNEPRNFKIIYGSKEPTQKQLDTLFDWHQEYGEAEIINPAGEW